MKFDSKRDLQIANRLLKKHDKITQFDLNQNWETTIIPGKLFYIPELDEDRKLFSACKEFTVF